MDGLSLDNPWAWEELRLTLAPEELVARLRPFSCELGRIRLADALLGLKTDEGVDEAMPLLLGQQHPLAEALLINALMQHRLWHQAHAIAANWVHPLASSPLIQEANYLMSIFGSMVAHEVKDHALANRLLGRAELLHAMLGLKLRDIMLRGEIQRVNNLDGRGNPEAIRAILQEDLNDYQFRHNTHNLAETLAGRGQYADAIWELRDATDDRSAGMRAFYAAMLNRPFDDPGTKDDYLRLARTVANYRRGMFEPGDIECNHEPQATYARLLTTEALTHAPTAGQRYAGLQLPIPALHDQKVWWVLNRLGALSKGIPVPEAHLIYDVWESAVSGLHNLRDILDAKRLHRFGDRLLVLAAISDAPDQVLRLRHQLPVLMGKTIIYKGSEFNAAGRIGGVMIAETFCPNIPSVKPLGSSEPGRWDDRVMKLIRAGDIPHAPINPGASLRAAVTIRDARRALHLNTAKADTVIGRLLSELDAEQQALLYPYVRGGEYETTFADGLGGLSDPSQRGAGRTGGAVSPLPRGGAAYAHPSTPHYPPDHRAGRGSNN